MIKEVQSVYINLQTLLKCLFCDIKADIDNGRDALSYATVASGCSAINVKKMQLMKKRDTLLKEFLRLSVLSSETGP